MEIITYLIINQARGWPRGCGRRKRRKSYLIVFNNIEIIASAGIRNVDDILTLNKMGINGVIIGRALYDKKIIFNETIKKLEKDGIS